jgi:prefoldin subunit 5
MISVVAYKIAVVVLVAGLVGASGTTVYYHDQQGTQINKAADLNTQIGSLQSQIDSLNSQISKLNAQISQLQTLNNQLGGNNSQLISQIQQLQSQISQLQAQVSQLQAQIQILTKQVLTHTTLVSTGTISIPEGGTASTIQYVSFSVPSSVTTAYVNLTFAESPGNAALKIALLNQTQYNSFKCCEAKNALNYTSLPTSWSSPWAQSYTAQVSIRSVGNWYVAFLPTPGYIYGGLATETITLTTQSA